MRRAHLARIQGRDMVDSTANIQKTFGIAKGWAIWTGLFTLTAALACGGPDGREGFGGGIGAVDADGDGIPDDEDDDVDVDGDDADPQGHVPGAGDGDDEDIFEELPFDPQQLGKVCARGNADRVAQALCNGAQLHSMADLRAALAFQNPFFALTANSSSIIARDVSAINPRLIIGEKSFGGFDGGFEGFGIDNTLALGFARGDQLVELMGYDPNTQDLNLYLLKFEQPCNDTDEGCSIADMVTPAIEEGWNRWTLYQDTDLVNTTFDCNVCHQPGGPGTMKVPRLQEVSNSWTHWFPVRPSNQGGGWSSGGSSTAGLPVDNPGQHGTRSSEVLWNQFKQMHEVDGTYGGVGIDELLGHAAGPDIETFVRTYMALAGAPQWMMPPESPSADSDLYCDSPSMETQGEASTWATEYQRVVSGQRLPLPSHRIDITDPDMRSDAIAAYNAVMSDGAPPLGIIDPREVVSEEVLTEMSMMPRPGAQAEEILTHMCSRCHNSNLDQSLTRARFDATDLGSVDLAQRQLIALRVTMHEDDARLMPPQRYGTLPDWAVDKVLAWANQQ